MCALITSFTPDQQIQILNTLGTWLAAIATLGAVFVSLWLARRAEVVAHTPALKFHYNVDPTNPHYDFLGVELENVGSGVAYILPSWFWFNGVQVGRNEEGNNHGFRDNISATTRFLNVHHVTALAPGARQKMVWVEPKDYGDQLTPMMISKFQTMNIILVYMSVHGHTRVTSLQGYLNPEVGKSLRKLYKIPRKMRIIRD